MKKIILLILVLFAPFVLADTQEDTEKTYNCPLPEDVTKQDGSWNLEYGGLEWEGSGPAASPDGVESFESVLYRDEENDISCYYENTSGQVILVNEGPFNKPPVGAPWGVMKNTAMCYGDFDPTNCKFTLDEE